MALAQAHVTASPVAGLAEFSNVSGDLGGTLKNKSFKYQYWRKPDGTICIGPSWAIEAERCHEDGWESLKLKYGTFGLSEVRMNEDGEVVDKWSASQAPWKYIIARGGAKEFTLEQIVEHNWHRKPPYPGVHFPQLEGVEVHDVACNVCRKVFSHLDKRGAEAMLNRHESIAHKDASANNALSRSLADALKPGASQDALTGALTSLAETQKAILTLLGKKGA